MIIKVKSKRMKDYVYNDFVNEVTDCCLTKVLNIKIYKLIDAIMLI